MKILSTYFLSSKLFCSPWKLHACSVSFYMKNHVLFDNLWLLVTMVHFLVWGWKNMLVDVLFPQKTLIFYLAKEIISQIKYFDKYIYHNLEKLYHKYSYYILIGIHWVIDAFPIKPEIYFLCPHNVTNNGLSVLLHINYREVKINKSMVYGIYLIF